MGVPMIQIPSIVLPQAGAGTEDIDDLVTHLSIDIAVSDVGAPVVEWLQEKMVQIIATEVVAAGMPGNLWCWIELSPVASVVSAAYWAAIGGGGGALAPVAPTVVVATGVNGTVHTLLLPWTIHSPYARVVAQMPVAATPATDYWQIQCLFSGKSA